MTLNFFLRHLNVIYLSCVIKVLFITFALMDKSEDRIQQECVMWFTNTYSRHGKGIVFHVPNQQQQHLIGIGVLPGVSDLIIVLQGKVLFIEVKTNKGVQSDSQKRFEINVNILGHVYTLIRSLDEFKSFILSHM